MSWIITYLMVGVFGLFLYEKAVDYLESELRFNNRERVIVGLLWPIMLLIFIYHFIKTIINGPY
jgi:hypothetical protein